MESKRINSIQYPLLLKFYSIQFAVKETHLAFIEHEHEQQTAGFEFRIVNLLPTVWDKFRRELNTEKIF